MTESDIVNPSIPTEDALITEALEDLNPDIVVRSPTPENRTVVEGSPDEVKASTELEKTVNKQVKEHFDEPFQNSQSIDKPAEISKNSIEKSIKLTSEALVEESLEESDSVNKDSIETIETSLTDDSSHPSLPVKPQLVVATSHDTESHDHFETDAVSPHDFPQASFTASASASTPDIILNYAPSISETRDNLDRESITSLPASRRHKNRSPSIALSISSTSSGQKTVSSMVFIQSALELISKSKEAKRTPALENATKKALDQLARSELPTPNVLFEPFRLACLGSDNTLKVRALDCIAKLLSFSYLEDPIPRASDLEDGITPPPVAPIIDRAIDTVCDCFNSEGTDPKVELQVIKALMAAVLNDEVVAHGATLLKAIRQTYNIFILSHSNPNQTIAQATLTQMVNVVFERVKNIIKINQTTNIAVGIISDKTRSRNASVSTTSASAPGSPVLGSKPSQEKLTLQHFKADNIKDDDRVQEANSGVGRDESDLFVKDAFLVFRAMCKLSIKDLESDNVDMKSHAMRSKLLSMHLIHTMLRANMSVFLSKDVVIRSTTSTEQTSFINAVRLYICLTLSRNAASVVPAIFEISAEIFWLLISNLRSQFKKEIEVFFNEIYFYITDMRSSSPHQKQYFLSVIQRLCNDPRALVEIYLNYDCDHTAMTNIYEKIIDYLVRLAVTPVHLTQLQHQQFLELKGKPIAVYNLSLPPALSIQNLNLNSHNPDILSFPVEQALKVTALESLVAVLRSLLTWSQKGITATSASLNSSAAASIMSSTSSLSSLSSDGKPLSSDDPTAFENLKLKKTALNEGIKLFNFKPKRGIESLISGGFIKSNTPEDIAEFLLTCDGLDKAVIGEYLGEGDPTNIAIMHTFVNLMDVNNMNFVDALRRLLQAFRLPGEAQKIDRFMLKFAERYVSLNPGVFANADAGYVLAYSVIMLNTDLHSPQVKVRMQPIDFIRNNKGINDNADLPEEFLLKIYDEILNNEIKLKSEQHEALVSGANNFTPAPSGFGAAFGIGNRDLNREAYLQASREMSNKTEQVFKNLSKGGKDSNVFYTASHFEHVRPMFEFVWMSFLAGLSGPLQETDEPEIVKLSLEGIRYAIRIVCLFDIELARVSFVSMLAKFTSLQKLNEMKLKNVQAIKVLLDVALTEGNALKSSWKDILTVVSHLERFQLIISGISAGSIPDLNKASVSYFKQFTQGRSSQADSNLTFLPEVASESRTREIVDGIEKIFIQSSLLTGSAIVDFVKALTQVSNEEIASSAESEQPRTFSLQKMVEVSYYNMGRIRVEWSNIWAVMGESFNQVGCHPNTNVSFFALDSLRQLSMRFFDIEELPHFKFQKDFLKPFEYVMEHNDHVTVKDMVLQILQQMILSNGSKIKSGWKAMFNVFMLAARDTHASIIISAFNLAEKVHNQFLPEVIAQDSFPTMVDCLSALAQNQKYQQTSLHAVELLKATIFKVHELIYKNKDTNNELCLSIDDPLTKFWMPVLSCFHDITMNGEDLEVRSRAQTYLFETLIQYGERFDVEFWDTICNQLLFPTFTILKSKSEMIKYSNQDDTSVWLSTTMIQALRNMTALFGHYFSVLERMLDGFLTLLHDCVCQENDTISRIGSSCLQQLIVQNMTSLTDEHWHKIVGGISRLFQENTAHELFTSCNANMPDDENLQDNEPPVQTTTINPENQKVFRTIIVKSVLQLLMIETVDTLFSDENIYLHIPPCELLAIAEVLRGSYHLSHTFNSDNHRRLQLWKAGFMKQMPNLHKQEINSALTYLKIMFHVYNDPNSVTLEQHYQIGELVIPLCLEIFESYLFLDETQQQRFINIKQPVVVSILNGYVAFPRDDFVAQAGVFYGLILRLFDRDITAPELRLAMKRVLTRINEAVLNDALAKR
ncbi:hypothetical protein NADFUDRAFT_54895 [Nadsonia fulvescens var. elongata DSM 6958]|uniref:SEC7 domain-containing protein n=1 Tax=Nadsonia fulvescens var. elongata DSM 6958 TaxID=857566 RepID=A0A1E3PSN5_9ASCO|nr:hypothetical protein NADFUDRAFT_54895 [Nadsonia fulvescens var. elongata DSM 6958]